MKAIIKGKDYEILETDKNVIIAGKDYEKNETDKLKKIEDYFERYKNLTDKISPSIGSIDYAVRRRFAFISVPANADIIKSTWDDEKIGEEAENLYKALLEGGEQIEGKQTKGIFDEEYLEDTEIDVEDIKIGHSYFLGENKSKEENDENDYLSYRIKYQVFPIYKEYIKDGIIKKSGEKNFKDICKHHNIDL